MSKSFRWLREFFPFLSHHPALLIVSFTGLHFTSTSGVRHIWESHRLSFIYFSTFILLEGGSIAVGLVFVVFSLSVGEGSFCLLCYYNVNFVFLLKSQVVAKLLSLNDLTLIPVYISNFEEGLELHGLTSDNS